MARIVRIVAASFMPPAHDHYGKGVDLSAVRDVAQEIMRDRPDFICFPELCACYGSGLDLAKQYAPEIEPYAQAVGQLARELNVNLVVPLLERWAGLLYNSVPVVDRAGKLCLNYRKNYPTMGELQAGVQPGWEVPVAECDGVRVGAAVCFDLNFADVAQRLEAGRARLVFWPSMYWGGRLLHHWALRYGFYIAASYGSESSITDMSGRFLAQRGYDSIQVRSGHVPPWAVAEVNLDREVYHIDTNQEQYQAIHQKYGADVELDVFDPEGYFLLASRLPDKTVEDLAQEFGLETLRDYLARSVALREQYLRAHPPETP